MMTVTALSMALSSHCRRNSKVIPPFGCLRLYTIVRLVVTSRGIIQYILYISSLNGDIEKMIASSGIFDLSPRSPNLSPNRSRPGRCRPFHTYPCETLFPNISLAMDGSDIPFL
ncbi:hypothetical protein AVEN_214344-1 [Araneus ventricosus]|uniref:Uncharacterized protein n=1 Tax=Araneus ventricosus TaxID=182803 RepID=A0A4Y2UBQ1_ARAVE|nr:hypothetical protein AVEN_214344-1 [Araneus ventricosus]